MGPKITGWLWTDPHMIGNLDTWDTRYGWDGDFYETRREAIDAGLFNYGSDDFNIAHVVDDVVDWWGWQTESHDLSDAAEFASQHDFTVGVTASVPDGGTE